MARWLLVHGGRQGGGLQSAHGDVVFTNTGTSACELHGLPKVAVLRGDGSALSTVPFSEVRPDLARWGLTLRSVVLAPDRHGRASLTLSWQNWCGGKLGALEISVTLPHGGGTVTGPFNGPPSYDYVPGCVAPGNPSTVQVTYAYSPGR
jgi:hypothetical protein